MNLRGRIGTRVIDWTARLCFDKDMQRWIAEGIREAARRDREVNMTPAFFDESPSAGESDA